MFIKSPPLGSTLGNMNAVHTIPSYLFNISFDIILPMYHFHQNVPPTAWISRPSHAWCMPRVSHPPWCNHPNNIRRRAQIIKLFIVQYVHRFFITRIRWTHKNVEDSGFCNVTGSLKYSRSASQKIVLGWKYRTASIPQPELTWAIIFWRQQLYHPTAI